MANIHDVHWFHANYCISPSGYSRAGTPRGVHAACFLTSLTIPFSIRKGFVRVCGGQLDSLGLSAAGDLVGCMIAFMERTLTLPGPTLTLRIFPKDSRFTPVMSDRHLTGADRMRTIRNVRYVREPKKP
jgi:hypothetical protein